MNTLLRTITATLLLAGGSLAQAREVNIGVSIAGEFQPGVYGQVNINTMPGYSLMYPQPTVMVQPAAYAVPVQPVYLHVPVAHARYWPSHCGYYNACSRPVYFVQPHHHDRHRHQSHDHGHRRRDHH